MTIDRTVRKLIGTSVNQGTKAAVAFEILDVKASDQKCLDCYFFAVFV